MANLIPLKYIKREPKITPVFIDDKLVGVKVGHIRVGEYYKLKWFTEEAQEWLKEKFKIEVNHKSEVTFLESNIIVERVKFDPEKDTYSFLMFDEKKHHNLKFRYGPFDLDVKDNKDNTFTIDSKQMLTLEKGDIICIIYEKLDNGN